MTLPKNLQEKRDKSYDKHLENKECTCDENEYGCVYRDQSYDYKSGWNDCANLLLPEIKKLVEAMKFAAAEDMWESDGEYVESFSYQYKEWYQDKLDEALQSLREFLGKESECKNV